MTTIHTRQLKQYTQDNYNNTYKTNNNTTYKTATTIYTRQQTTIHTRQLQQYTQDILKYNCLSKCSFTNIDLYMFRKNMEFV